VYLLCFWFSANISLKIFKMDLYEGNFIEALYVDFIDCYVVKTIIWNVKWYGQLYHLVLSTAQNFGECNECKCKMQISFIKVKELWSNNLFIHLLAMTIVSFVKVCLMSSITSNVNIFLVTSSNIYIYF